MTSASGRHPDLGQERSAGTLLGPTFERLARLRALERDWDGYGALPLTATALAHAEVMIRRVVERCGEGCAERVAPYTVMPIADGGVSVEWRGADAHLELDVGPDGSLSYLLIEHPTGDRRFEEGAGLTERQALDLVGRVVGG